MGWAEIRLHSFPRRTVPVPTSVVVHGQVGGLQDLVLGQRLVLQLPIEGVVLHVQLLNQGGHWSLTDQAVKQTEDNYLSENNNLTDYKPFGDNFVYISISK